jgi:hypothetical protein
VLAKATSMPWLSARLVSHRARYGNRASRSASAWASADSSAARHHPVGQAHHHSTFSLDAITEEQEFFGMQQADVYRQCRGAAVACDKTDQNMGVGQERGVGHQDHVRH